MSRGRCPSALPARRWGPTCRRRGCACTQWTLCSRAWAPPTTLRWGAPPSWRSWGEQRRGGRCFTLAWREGVGLST